MQEFETLQPVGFEGAEGLVGECFQSSVGHSPPANVRRSPVAHLGRWPAGGGFLEDHVAQ